MQTRIRRAFDLTLPVVGILLIAASLRFWRIGAGLDEGLGHPDEFRWFIQAAGFVPLSCRSFDLDATIFFYPTLFGYAVGLTTALAHGVGALGADPLAAVPQILLSGGSV